MTLAEIIQSKNFPKGSCPCKESQLIRSLSPPNPLSRERGSTIRKENLIKSFNLKRSSSLRASNKGYHHHPEPLAKKEKKKKINT